MTSVTPFVATDLLDMNSVNLDNLTENYQVDYYIMYLASWPSLLFKTNTKDRCVGYMIGKSEGKGPEWHSHITAVTVDMEFRRLGLGKLLVDQLELSSDAEKCNFMDLYVRASNIVAIDMYKKFGFSVFRRVFNYYGSSDNEDAFDMRMPLAADPKKHSLIKGPHTEESQYYTYSYDPKQFKS